MDGEEIKMFGMERIELGSEIRKEVMCMPSPVLKHSSSDTKHW